MRKNFYDILGVPQNALPRQIKERFLTLARERHPDRFQGAGKEKAEREFQAITQAFNVLSDPERRRQHDLELAQPEGTQQSTDAEEVARVYLQRGIRAYKEKNYLAAAESFDRAAKSSPDNARAWHHLALACSTQERWQGRALSAIQSACKLDPINVSYLKLAGKLFARAGMKIKAKQYYKQALQWGGSDREIDNALEELEGKKGFFGGRRR